jgi:hypothetical protein
MTTLLASLIDYAGLYPPAGLDMRTAVRNYLAYQRSAHAGALGRFIVNLDRIDDLRWAAGDDLRKMKLSVLVPTNADCDHVSALIGDGLPIESIETKIQLISEIASLTGKLPSSLEIYFEIGMGSVEPEILGAIAAAGARVKLRMGGVTAEAFPSAAIVARVLRSLARHGLSFKATAGLHHPIRSRHPFTYAPDSPAGWMHGFMNLLCAATLIHSGRDAAEAETLLEEQDPGAFRVTPQAISWRSHVWDAHHLSRTRRKLISFGSCSFEEPIRDLEALGWL